MSEQPEQQHAEDLKLAYDGQSVDWYLQKLVTVVNTSTLEFGVTLNVEGTIVSGLLIGGRKYFETFASEFAGAYPGNEETKESMRQAFASHASIYDQPEDERELSPPQFIHLADARCFAPGAQPIPNNRTVLWRGKINAVSGFSLGSLSAP